MIDDDFNIDFGNIELPDLDLDLFAGPGVATTQIYADLVSEKKRNAASVIKIEED